MNAQQLRNSILQEAIEGRLVPQDPNDEPASVLLERIREEKKRLVKEGKLKKKDLEEKPINDEEKPFEIPESWEWVRWGTLSESIQYGYNTPAKEKGRIKMVRISDIQNGEIAWTTTPYCDIDEQDIDAYKLKKNDILFARTGGTVGKSYLVSEEPQEAIYAGYLIRTRYSRQLCPQYLKMFMDSSLYWEQLKDGTIATAQPNCNGQKLAKMILPLPPLAEQKRIVAKIEELLPKVEEYGKAQEALDKLNKELPERLKKSILQEAITGRLVPQDPNDEPASVLLDKIRKEKARLVKEGKLKKKDLEETPISEDEKPFEIPESWEWVRIGNVGEVVTGGTPSKSESKFYGDEYPFYKPADLEQGLNTCKSADSLSVEGYNHSRKLQKDSVLVTCIGSIGKSGIIRREGSCNQQINAVIPCNKLIIAEYLYYFITSSHFQESMWENSSSTTLAILNKNKFSQLKIALPPFAEQKRIVEKIEEVFKEIDKLKK